MDSNPNRPRDASSPLIQECKCRWKCVSIMIGLHGQAPPLSAVKRTLATTLPARSLSPPQIPPSNPAAGPSASPRSAALSSLWDWPLQLVSAETLFGTAKAPCLLARSRSRHTSSYHAQQMPCNTLTCLQLTTPCISHCGCYPKPQTFDICMLCLRPFASVALGGPVQAHGMV